MLPELPTCPACQSSRVAEIFFGLPGEVIEVLDTSGRDHIIFGGCDVHEGMPRWHCRDCKHEWGVSDWEELLKLNERARLEKLAEAERLALARGVMRAVANEHGFVKCPHCQFRFSIRHAMSWDGTMHKSCRTRLEILEAGE